MVKDSRITKLRNDLKSLRQNCTGAFTAANQAFYDGVEQLVEHEFAALRAHYAETCAGLKEFKNIGAPRQMACAQMQRFQNTIGRVARNARESLEIIADTRRQVRTQIYQNLSGSRATARQAVERAERATGQAVRGTRDEAQQRVTEAATAARQAVDETAGQVQTAQEQTTTHKSSDAVTAATDAAELATPVRKSTARKRTPTARRQTSSPTQKTRQTNKSTAGRSGARTSSAGQSATRRSSPSAARKRAPSQSAKATDTSTRTAAAKAGAKTKNVSRRKTATDPEQSVANDKRSEDENEQVAQATPRSSSSNHTDSSDSAHES